MVCLDQLPVGLWIKAAAILMKTYFLTLVKIHNAAVQAPIVVSMNLIFINRHVFAVAHMMHAELGVL